MDQDSMPEPTIRQLVAFLILMQNGRGLMSKSPDYIHNKLNSCLGMADPKGLLDSQNQTLYEEYLRYWHLNA